jgi:hypothetical protein
MKKLVCIFIVSIFLFSITNLAFSESISLSDIERLEVDKLEQNDVEYYALIIGVENFSGFYIPEDKTYYLAETAQGMYDFLKSCPNWKEENMKLLLDEDGTKEKIHDAIVNWLDDKEDENDVVLIFYTSHGWKTKIAEKKYGNAAIFTYNVTEENKIEDKITDIEFDLWVDELESKNIAIILESCYSGKMFALRQRGRVILAAGGKYVFCGVDDSDYLKFGIFAQYLIEGFTGVADLNNDGWVTAEEAFSFSRIHTILTSIWEQFPFFQKYGNRTIFWAFQVPQMYDRYLGSLPLIQLSDED